MKTIAVPAVQLPVLTPFQADPYSGFGQWLTDIQAQQFVAWWNANVPSCPILAGDDLAVNSTPGPNGNGIYIPGTVTAYFQTQKVGPDGVVYYWLHFRFGIYENGSPVGVTTNDFNAGLIVNEFARFPYSTGYPLQTILQAVLASPTVPYQS